VLGMCGIDETENEGSKMDHKYESAIFNVLRQVKNRLIEEAEYDYEAKELVHKIDRILVGKLPQKNSNQLKESLSEAL